MSAAEDLAKVEEALREALKRNPEGSADAAAETERILREQRGR